MTRFYREGHYRTNQLGNTYWVSGHDVERRCSDYPSHYTSRLQELRAERGAIARYINPNANCPVCDAPVFYYQNEFGSRVFFDELGPPWPKHPCTDQGPVPSTTGPRPTPRDATERALISELLAASNLDPQSDFKRRYGTNPWRPYQVKGRYPTLSRTLAVLEAADGDGVSLKFVAVRRLPRTVTCGTLVFINRGRLACFNTSKMEPQEFHLKILRGASAFVKTLVGDELNSTPED